MIEKHINHTQQDVGQKKNSMGRDIYQTVFILLNFLQTGGNNRRFFFYVCMD